MFLEFCRLRPIRWRPGVRRDLIQLLLATHVLAIAACAAPVAPRGRFRMPGQGRVSIKTGWHLAKGDVTARATKSEGGTVPLSGRSPGPLVDGGESGVVAGMIPSAAAFRVQWHPHCDGGWDLGWSLAGADIRCALPGTDDWVGLSVGGRYGYVPRAPLAPRELRASFDLVKPTRSSLVPIVNLGGSWGRQIYFASEPVSSSKDPFGGVDLLFTRSEVRLEQAVGLELHLRPLFFVTAVVAHEVLTHEGLTGEDAAAARLIDAKHEWAVGLTVMVGLEDQRRPKPPPAPVPPRLWER
jgi:hypothetical protein